MDPTTAANAVDDYRALREGAAFVDLSSWTLLRARGPDAISFLQGIAAQDLGAEGDRAVETLFLTEKGRPVALAWVRPDPAASIAWVVADEGSPGALRAHLERFRIMEDLEIEGPGGLPRLLGLAGPFRASLLRETARSASGSVGIEAEPISFLLMPEGSAPEAPPRSADPAAFEAWRLAVGLPRAGVDFDESRIATELSLPEAISLTKGCYVGQEVVARTSHRGSVRRRRVGFRFELERGTVAAGAELYAGETRAGTVTSAAAEPGTARGLGMGYLSTDIQDPAHVVAVQGPATTPLEIASWPL